MEGHKTASAGTVAFGEDEHSAAGLDPGNAGIDGFKRLAGIFPVNELPAQHKYPYIQNGSKYQFFFGDKTKGPIRIGKYYQYINETSVVAHKTDAAFTGYIFPARDGHPAAQYGDHEQPPTVGAKVH
jgi:hypothetical protein